MSSTENDSNSQPHARWGILIGLLAFILLMLAPTPAGMEPAAMRLIATITLMGIFWFTEVIPTGATSLVPIVAFPLLGIMPASQVSKLYMDHNILLFLGGFIIALGIEKWDLHRRLALHVVHRVGDHPRRLVLGFMLGTAGMSMWISNTASSLLMLPLAMAMMTSLKENGMQKNEVKELSTVLILSIAYAASIGGSTTLVGTPTNLVFVKVWAEQFPDQPEFTAGQWMLHFVPVGCVLLLVAWLYLVRKLPKHSTSNISKSDYILNKLKELGSPSQAELVMSSIFGCTALLWILRKPIDISSNLTIPGWEPWLLNSLSYFRGVDTSGVYLHDSTVAIGMSLLMFIIPVKGNNQTVAEPLMDWETAKKVPWAILFLIGGGFAIASAAKETALSDWVGQQLVTELVHWPVWGWVLAICLLMTFLTEFTSNVATASALMPILAVTAIGLDADPKLLMLPAILSTSCAFMLPIATPPNAIVYSSGLISMKQMAWKGVWLNLLFAVLITLATFAYLT